MKAPDIASDCLAELATTLEPARGAARLNIDPEKVEQGLMKLVLVIVELLRQLLERQALRRMEAGTLTGEEIDRLGTTFMRLEEKVKALQKHFQIEDLNLNLGPLGKLLDEEER